jgi:hypothetical protein
MRPCPPFFLIQIRGGSPEPLECSMPIREKSGKALQNAFPGLTLDSAIELVIHAGRATNT